MNFIRLADGVSGLLPKKLKVTLLRASSEEKIGDFKFREEQLPAVFDKPTLIEAGGKIWQILKANIVRESSYLFSRKIRLYVEESGVHNLPGKYLIPTRPFGDAELLEVEDAVPVFRLLPEDWRQIEFLPVAVLPEIEKDLEKVERVMSPLVSSNTLLGYDELHLRDQMYNGSLQIPLQEFSELVSMINYGPVSVGAKNMVKNGFAMESFQNTYYGICNDGMITELAIQNFESIDSEIASLSMKYSMVLVDWCNARVFMDTPEDAPEKEIVKI